MQQHSVWKVFSDLSSSRKMMIVVEGTTDKVFVSTKKEVADLIVDAGYSRLRSIKGEVYTRVFKDDEYPIVSEGEYESTVGHLSELFKNYRPVVIGATEYRKKLFEYWKKEKLDIKSQDLISYNDTPVSLRKYLINELLYAKCYAAWSLYDNFKKNAERIKNKATYKFMDLYGLKFPILEFKYDDNQSTYMALSHWIWTDSGGGTAFEGFGEASLVGNKIKSEKPDPTTPKKEQKITGNADLIDNVLRKFIKAKGSGVYSQIRIDDAIKHKEVCVFGHEYGSIDELIDGICYLFGLEKTVKSGVCQIGIKKARKITNLRYLYDEVLQVLPADYIRWAKIKENPNVDMNSYRMMSRPAYIKATRDLRARIEPLMNTHSGEIRFSDTDQDVRNLFYTSRMIVMLELFPEIKAMNTPLLRDLNNLYWSIRLQREDAQEAYFTLRFVAKDDIGNEEISIPRRIEKSKA